MSPAGRGSPSRVLAGTAFDSAFNKPLPEGVGDKPGDPLNLILRAFVPHVAIHASADVEEISASKGFKHGFWELLRPFGERIQGKVAIRDSNGVSKLAEDYSVRFTRFGENVEHPDPSGAGLRSPTEQSSDQESTSKDRQTLADVESVVDRHLSYAEESFLNSPQHSAHTTHGLDIETTSPYYALFLRRLLSGLPIVPHEAFAHPVACVVAVSARSEDSVSELRQIYTETSQGSSLPPWVDGDYLRYYVLVHDEENDDIQKSMALFEQMKRHLGLHCHLLRLRSSQSAETDDDSIPLPRSDWMSPEEEMAEIKRSENEEDFDDPTRYIFESDATAIRTFVREMVTQSIVPTMERHVSIWNDQVASRRRGFAGRFMNLSRKFNFGGGGRSSTGSNSMGKDNYDAAGFFRADAPEAVMRKLADYAFMLRDWKLAHSTYELLRTDYADSKAWKYHAAANEMAAVSLLIQPQTLSSKSRAETIDQMLESAFYSYNTRCSAPYGAMRSLTLTIELLRLRGGTNIDDASRWGIRLLESRILGPVGDALIKERLAICYASKEGVGSWHWGTRRRKSAAWSILAADAWVQQARYLPAQRCLNEAQKTYKALPSGQGISQFKDASRFVESLQHGLSDKLDHTGEGGPGSGGLAAGDEHDDDYIDEESEKLTDGRPRRSSAARRTSVIETAPLHEDDGEGDRKGFDQS